MNKSENILFVITKSEVGGAQKFVKEQIEISSSEFNVFLCTNKADWLTNETQLFVKNTLLNKAIDSKISIAFLLQLIKFIKANNINLVVTNSANAGLYGRIAAFFTSTPSCYFSHGWSSVYNGGRLSFLLNFIEKLLSKISAKVICVSANDAQIARCKIGVNPKKIELILNGTMPIFRQRPTASLLNNKLKIIALARFANPKRIDLMIESCKSLPFVDLHIAGSGPDFEYWSKYVNENKLSNIHLLNEIPSFDSFCDYDLFMLLSNSEGLPISAIEAMSANLPLLLSNVGGCPELINKNGILVENNINAIQSALLKINENYIYYQTKVLPFYNANFNLSNIKLKYINVYKSLIK